MDTFRDSLSSFGSKSRSLTIKDDIVLVFSGVEYLDLDIKNVGPPVGNDFSWILKNPNTGLDLDHICYMHTLLVSELDVDVDRVILLPG